MGSGGTRKRANGAALGSQPIIQLAAMKTSKRPIPMDALCVEDKDYKLRLLTHRNKIIVAIEKEGLPIFEELLTVGELVSRLLSR